MDAKSRARFINSIAGGQKVPCPSCNTLNDADAAFCITCGTSLKTSSEAKNNTEGIICPVCKAMNDADAGFCTSCGEKLKKETVPEVPKPVRDVSAAAPAFQPARQAAAASQPTERRRTAFRIAEPEVEVEEEPVSVFAEGLPDWDIVPPQIMVRRKRKK